MNTPNCNRRSQSRLNRINPKPPPTARPVDLDLFSRALKHKQSVLALVNAKGALAFKMEVPSTIERKIARGRNREIWREKERKEKGIDIQGAILPFSVMIRAVGI